MMLISYLLLHSAFISPFLFAHSFLSKYTARQQDSEMHIRIGTMEPSFLGEWVIAFCNGAVLTKCAPSHSSSSDVFFSWVGFELIVCHDHVHPSTISNASLPINFCLVNWSFKFAFFIFTFRLCSLIIHFMLLVFFSITKYAIHCQGIRCSSWLSHYPTLIPWLPAQHPWLSLVLLVCWKFTTPA